MEKKGKGSSEVALAARIGRSQAKYFLDDYTYFEMDIGYFMSPKWIHFCALNVVLNFV